MANTFEEWIAALPASIEPEFVMSSPDEQIRLAVGQIELSRGGRNLGSLDGEVLLEWRPRVQIVCVGDSDAALPDLHDDTPVDLHVRQLGLQVQALVTNIEIGERHEIRALLLGAQNNALAATERIRFYLVNFPSVLGDLVRHGKGALAGASRHRLRFSAGPLVCTVDQIVGAKHIAAATKGAGYLLTHVGQIERLAQPFSHTEVHEILDALYWFFAFLRGARPGPVLPSSESPFAKHWVAIEQWSIGEARRVETWLPDRSPITVDSVFGGFINKWNDPIWNEGLRTTLAWYVTANAPSTPNEARVTLCQIALEVLASLNGFEDGKAHERIRHLLQMLRIPTQVPTRLQALSLYAAKDGIDASECLTRIRNKFEHPTEKHRTQIAAIDGVTRMEAAQYGLEMFELCLLGIMGYQGRYARRAFQGWKGEDEVTVPWA